MFLILYQKIRVTVTKLQLIILQPLITVSHIIGSFDLTCCTSSYDFGTEGFCSLDSLLIPHIDLLTVMKMQIAQSSPIFTSGKFSHSNIRRILTASNLILSLLAPFISHRVFLLN